MRHLERAETSRWVVALFPPQRQLHVSSTGVLPMWPLPPQRPAADLGTVVKESVAAHLVSDVPVSTFLSGGLDSSTVTVLAHSSTPGSTPIRSLSAARTSDWRPCLTTRSTRGRWRTASASACTKSRSRRNRRTAASHRRRSRRTDRRACGDQHVAHLRGSARARRQGGPVRNGCGRVVRWLPQAPGVRLGGQVPKAPQSLSRFRPDHRGLPARQRGGPWPALYAMGETLSEFRRAARRAALSP